MPISRMYTAVNNSVPTTLSAAIDAEATEIVLTTSITMPSAPNVLTIGTGGSAELVYFTGRIGFRLTGCVRGYNGTVAQAWPAGTLIYRSYTAVDHQLFVSNINALSKEKLAVDGTAVNAEKLDGKGPEEFAPAVHAARHAAGGADPVTAADVGASNPNLLINGGLAVWQRGTSFAAPSNVYTADRWRANGTGTVTKAAGGLQVTGTVTLVYVMEDADYTAIAGKQVTLSKSINGVVTSQTFVASSATVVSLPLTNQTVNWVKLEIGKVATAFSARPYAEELTLCQRYYQVLGNISFFAPYYASINNWYYRAASYFWCVMRVTPALKRASAYVVNVGAIADENLVIDMTERGISLINVKNVGAVPQIDNSLVMTSVQLDAEIY